MIDSLSAALARLPDESRGAIGLAIAQFFFITMDSMAKHLAETLPPLQVVWARYAGQTVLILLLLAPRLRATFETTNLRLQILRSVLLFATTIFYFGALASLELAEAASLMHLAPLIIVALAALVLGEDVGPRRWIGVGIGLVGALIVIRPGMGVFQPAALLAIGAAVCLASYQAATRALGAQDSIWTTILYTTLFGTAGATLLLPFVWVTPPWEAVPMLIVIGAVGMTGHMCLVWALTQAPASVLAPFNYLGLVWAVVFGMVFFAEMPDALMLLGSAVIVGAGLYVWHRERMRGAAKDA